MGQSVLLLLIALGLLALRYAPLLILGLTFANVGGWLRLFNCFYAGPVHEAAEYGAHTEGRNTVCAERYGGVYSDGDLDFDAAPAAFLVSPRKNKSSVIFDSA